MACPCFCPDNWIPTAAVGTAMLPLGDSWPGTCRAAANESWTPDSVTLRNVCNLGYARGNCARFPGGEHPDSVRFSIASDDGAAIRLYCVVERDHLPFAHGPAEYSITGAGFVQAPPEGTAPLALAYISSYLRRKTEASKA